MCHALDMRERFWGIRDHGSERVFHLIVPIHSILVVVVVDIIVARSMLDSSWVHYIVCVLLFLYLSSLFFSSE